MLIKVKIASGEIDVFTDKPYLEKRFCKACRMPIYWVKTTNGKWMPICEDKDGTFVSHHSNCKNVNQFRRKKEVEATCICGKCDLEEAGKILCSRCKKEFIITEEELERQSGCSGNGELICWDCIKDIEEEQ